MCEKSPVRTVLARWSVRQIESALAVAREREANTRQVKDVRSREIFARLVADIESELNDRLAVIATRDILKESQEADRQSRQLITQMIQ